MLEDLTHDQWMGWLNYFIQDPWDEKRKDDRSAVNAIWSIRPHLEEGADVPGFDGPAYSANKEDPDASWERLKEMKRKFLSGQLNSKTSDPTNG
jgi:hypothetical protein